MARAAIHGSSWPVPEPPPRSFGLASWRDVDLVVVEFRAPEVPDARGDGFLTFGSVPVHEGRVSLAGAIAGEASCETGGWHAGQAGDTLHAALQGRYVAGWSGASTAAGLDRLFGGGRSAWLRRTVDVHRLVALLGRRSRAPDPGRNDLARTARAFKVPDQPPADALDAAVMVAELLLITATTLEARGRGTLRDLVS